LKKNICGRQQSTEQQNPFKRAKILIVDDEDTIRLLIRDILTENGYDVLEAKSGEEALNKVKDTMFDLLITDIKMPGMNGLELLTKVKTGYPDIAVIVITGYLDVKHEEYSITHGAADFIAKSSQFERLLASVNRTLKSKVMSF
jgi:DNA-binding NtrC family response regulator